MQKTFATEHMSVNELSDWLSGAPSGSTCVYARGRSFSKDAGCPQTELNLMRDVIQMSVMKGRIALTQKRLDVYGAFEYRATKLTTPDKRPGWTLGCFCGSTELTDVPEHLTAEGANALALRIAEFWHSRGKTWVRTWVDTRVSPDKHVLFCVRSNLELNQVASLAA